LAEVNYFLVTKKFNYISFYFINKLLQEEMAGNGMPQIEDSNDANKQKEAVKKRGRNRAPTFTGIFQKSAFYP